MDRELAKYVEQVYKLLAGKDMDSCDSAYLLALYRVYAKQIVQYRLSQFQYQFNEEKEQFDEQAKALLDQIRVYNRLKITLSGD